MRLSKIAKDFNVGIQTLVEYLEKKGGDPNMSWGPMSHVSDEQYKLLSREFNKKQSARDVSQEEGQGRIQTHNKIEEETSQINSENYNNSQLKVIGHIDLDSLQPKRVNKTHDRESIKSLLLEYYSRHNKSISTTVEYIYSSVEHCIDPDQIIPFGNSIQDAPYSALLWLFTYEREIFNTAIKMYESKDDSWKFLQGDYLISIDTVSKNKKGNYTNTIGNTKYCIPKILSNSTINKLVLLIFIASNCKCVFLKKELPLKNGITRYNYSLLKYDNGLILENDSSKENTKSGLPETVRQILSGVIELFSLRDQKLANEILENEYEIIKNSFKTLEESKKREIDLQISEKEHSFEKEKQLLQKRIDDLVQQIADGDTHLQEEVQKLQELLQKKEEQIENKERIFEEEREQFQKRIDDLDRQIEEKEHNLIEERQLFSKLLSERTLNRDSDSRAVTKKLYPVRKIEKESLNTLTGLNYVLYGAPGTGKSHRINNTINGLDGETEKIEGLSKGKAFRTTFHPDTDYSSFIGCYKPTMKENDIVYSFTPQVFLKAYVEAWINPNSQYYLVIEELNRGNCAQIFGDMFQLLDRKPNGDSSYLIIPDQDISKWLKEEAFWYEDIDKEGEPKNHYEEYLSLLKQYYGSEFEEPDNGDCLMALPRNLTILATLNTSDQSLFPMDSAFKRRWKWKYVPIKKSKNPIRIQFEDDKFHEWESVLTKINNFIKEQLRSTDKQLGEFFLKALDGQIVSYDDFRDKVLFYLFNDVFKDDNRLAKSIWGEDTHNEFVDLYEEESQTRNDIYIWLTKSKLGLTKEKQ